MPAMRAMVVVMGLGLVTADVAALSPPSPAPTPRVATHPCGDANGDGLFGLGDGVEALRAVAELPTACTPFRCDVNGDGRVTAADGAGILQRVAFPSGFQPHLHRCPVPMTRRDLSGFTRFTLERRWGLGFCPPLESVFRVAIALQPDDTYELRLATVREDPTGTGQCMGPFGELQCLVEVPQPDRVLTDEELGRLREVSATVEVHDYSDPRCATVSDDYCVRTSYVWDDFAAAGDACGGRSLAGATESRLTEVLDSFIDAAP
jgi:hypothetical protein